MSTLIPIDAPAASVLAASAQRQIGYVIAGIVLLAILTYWFFNWLEGRNEAGAEIELAANRKPHMSDEDMETKRLDLALTGGLGLLLVIAIGLPMYWLGEPGRHAGLVEFTDDQAAKGGAGLYEENCSQCHGSVDGPGGVASEYSLVNGQGFYVEQVDWAAPSLAAALDRFSYGEVKYILNYGRQNSPMPAWGAPGGGPLTDQQIDKIIAYIAANQQSSEDNVKLVLEGVDQAAKNKYDNDDLERLALYNVWVHDLAEEKAKDDKDDALIAEIEAEIKAYNAARDAWAAEAKTVYSLAEQNQVIRDDFGNEVLVPENELSDEFKEARLLYGELLYNNPAGAGAYGCARCHSAGFSYGANNYAVDNPSIDPIVDGSGALGPSLIGVSDQFETFEAQVGFIVTGSKNGAKYGSYGQGDGGGQMPGFGGCWAEDDAAGELSRILTTRIEGHCADRTGGLLTDAQIRAIVAYERSLES